jgi:hypothetical protein
VAIRDDGTYAVQYYDLRNDTAEGAALRSDTWLVQSSDGVAWRETHLAGPFDFARAPLVREGNGFGYFIGDYQALTVAGAQFLGLFAQTTADASNIADVFAGIVTRPGSAAVAFEAKAAAAGATASPRLAHGVARNIARTLARRLNGDGVVHSFLPAFGVAAPAGRSAIAHRPSPIASFNASPAPSGDPAATWRARGRST